MRNMLAPLIIHIAKEWDLSVMERGTLIGAVAMGYFPTQLPGGMLADVIGTRAVIALSMGMSALCCVALPTAANLGGVNLMWVMLVLMGASQGPLFPTSTVILSKWMPGKTAEGPDEKAWGTGVMDVGISLGAMSVIPVVNYLQLLFGWRGAYHIVGGASFGFVVLFLIFGSENPQNCWYISKDERAYLEKVMPKVDKVKTDAKKEAGGGSRLLSSLKDIAHPAIISLFACHMAFNFGGYFMTNWSPSFYSEVLSMTPLEAQTHLMLPQVAGFIAKMISVWFVRVVEKMGVTLLGSRRLFTVVGLVIPSIFTLCIPVAALSGPIGPTVLFTLSNFGYGLAPAGFKSNYLDVTVKHVGLVSGIGNSLGTVSSYGGPLIIAFILQTYNSWNKVFAIMAVANILACCVFLMFGQVVPVDLKKTD